MIYEMRETGWITIEKWREIERLIKNVCELLKFQISLTWVLALTQVLELHAQPINDND